MAIQSSTLACRIPWTEKPGWLQSMESQRVRHDWVPSTVPKITSKRRMPMSSPNQRFASLVAQMIKNLPAVQETWVTLGWENPLEKGIATHSNILAWRIPQAVLSMGSQRVGHDWETFTLMQHFVAF